MIDATILNSQRGEGTSAQKRLVSKIIEARLRPIEQVMAVTHSSRCEPNVSHTQWLDLVSTWCEDSPPPLASYLTFKLIGDPIICNPAFYRHVLGWEARAPAIDLYLTVRRVAQEVIALAPEHAIALEPLQALSACQKCPPVCSEKCPPSRIGRSPVMTRVEVQANAQEEALQDLPTLVRAPSKSWLPTAGLHGLPS